MSDLREYTHPDVMTRGVTEGWAESVEDPTTIDWDERIRRAVVPFRVIHGRPVCPWDYYTDGVQRGRNELGHWGEQETVDIMVTCTYRGIRHVILIQRGDMGGDKPSALQNPQDPNTHPWALPGGYVDSADQSYLDTAHRELEEETTLYLPASLPAWELHGPYGVPDPRGSRESWMVTHLARISLGTVRVLPVIMGSDDARRALWVPCDTNDRLHLALKCRTGGRIWSAHRDLIHAGLTMGVIL